MASEVPDYTEDWKAYWTVKSNTSQRTQLKNAAQNPEEYYLSATLQELNNDSDEYDWQIEPEHIKRCPDRVLDDGKKGFEEFVEDSEIDYIRGRDYDILPLHLAGLSNYYYTTSSFQSLLKSTNQMTNLSGSVTDVSDRIYHATSINYQCPSGHETRLLQPIYQVRSIEICGEEGCHNSVYPISKGTTGREIFEFNVEYEGIELLCVTTGKYTNARPYEALTGGGRLNLTGILRKTVDSNNDMRTVYEVLYLDDSLR